MRKILLALAVVLVLLACVPAVMLLTGVIDSTSLRMVLNVMTGASGPPPDRAVVEQRYKVPEGFAVALYATLPQARFLRFTDGGDLLVSRPHAGDIVLLSRDADGDGRPDGQQTLLSDLKRPLGLDIASGWLYVAESHRIGRVPFDSERGALTGEYQPLVEGLTDNGNHWSKTLRVGPDGDLYLTQGSTCNVCAEEDPRRATMMRFDAEGGAGQILATGLRNSVGFDWAPWSGELYATDNGRDLLGDNFPPCELNRVRAGHFYGWPYYNGDNIPDPDMGPDPLAAQRTPTPPVHGFRAHNAPLGITFAREGSLGDGFERVALVALHGSWNRSSPDGYKVVALHFSDTGIEERDFLSGFLHEGDISGRPVDVAQGPDDAIYISDDYAGAIYRVYRNSGEAAASDLAVPQSRTRLDAKPPAWLAQADLDNMAVRGAALYEKYRCASCHEDGVNPRRLDGLSERMGYAAVIDVLDAPQAPMPVFPLTGQEKRELAVFLLQPPPAQE